MADDWTAAATAAEKTAPAAAPAPGADWTTAATAAERGPAFSSDEFVKAMAEKHGVTPEQVNLERHNAWGDAMFEGVPVAGAYVPQVSAWLQAISPYSGGARGATVGERYRKNLELIRDVRDAYHLENPKTAAALGMGTGAATMLAAAPTTAGELLLGTGAKTLGGQVLAGTASGTALGGADAAARSGGDPWETAKGALIGGGTGVVAPVVAKGIELAATPVIANIGARANPQAYAGRQAARAMTEAGMTPEQVGTALAEARADLQPDFTPADALGPAGQKMLANVVKAPGEGRQEAHAFLTERQTGQAPRVASQLAEAFEAPRTAEAVRADMEAARGAQADIAYPAARRGAGPVDLSRTIAGIDETLAPGVMGVAQPGAGLAGDTIENALQGVRNRLTDNRSMLSDFTAVQRVRGDLGDMVQSAERAGQGNRARLLRGVLRNMDAAMEEASPGYLEANRNFAQASRDIEAIEQGRGAFMRGRPENIVPEFQGLTPEGQAGWRTGYADPMIERVLRTPENQNVVPRFTSPAFRTVAEATAPGNAVLQRQLGREGTMYQTMVGALKGSPTKELLADDMAVGLDPVGLAGKALTGDIKGFLSQAGGAIGRGLTGNTPQVRRELVRILLNREATPEELRGVFQSAVDSANRSAATRGAAARTLAGTLANAANIYNEPTPVSPLARTLVAPR